MICILDINEICILDINEIHLQGRYAIGHDQNYSPDIVSFYGDVFYIYDTILDIIVEKHISSCVWNLRNISNYCITLNILLNEEVNHYQYELNNYIK